MTPIRKRKRKLERRLLGRRLEAKQARASHYLHRLRDYHLEHPDMVAIRYNRESSDTQYYRGNHDTHKWRLCRACKKYDIPYYGFYHETCSGKILNRDRKALLTAVRKAQALTVEGKHAVILATSTDRFLRNENFNPKYNPHVLPIEAQFERLMKLSSGVPLVTVVPPDRSWKKVRGYQSKWGQRNKGNKGGRPILKSSGWTIRRRKKKMPRVRKMLKRGKNVTEIARKLQMSRSTVDEWVKNYL